MVSDASQLVLSVLPGSDHGALCYSVGRLYLSQGAFCDGAQYQAEAAFVIDAT